MSTATRRPQLSLDELRLLKWLLGAALALVSLWTVFFLDIEALGLVGVAGAVILATLVWPRLPARVPPLLWKLAVPAIIVAVAADFYYNPETLPVLIRLAILLVLYRTVSYRRKREDLQLIVLGLFLIVVAGVLTVSLGFAFLLLFFTAVALGFLFVINLIESLEIGGGRTEPTETAAVPAWTRQSWAKLFGRLRQVADWRLLGLAGVLFVAVVGMSVLLFLVIPRFEIATGFFLDKYITRKSRTGFSESLKFGDVGELIRDESVALRADLTDASALRETPYWRLVVLDEYTPQGFRISTGQRNELLRSQRVVQFLRGRGGPRPVTGVGGSWTVYVEPGISRFLPLPGIYGTMRLRESVPVQTMPALRLVALRTESMTMTAFQLGEVELDAALPDSRLARLLAAGARSGKGVGSTQYDPLLTLAVPQGPENAAALARMVAQITGGRRLGAPEFASAAITWLRQHHAYTLSVKAPPGGADEIVRWLESEESGFCEYFAAGFAVLSRAAGHPARVITGYRGGALNAFENYLMVRNSEAHAWAEMFDQTAAVWRRVDPTPGGGTSTDANAAQAVQQERDSSWGARFDSLRVIWYRRIVNFDSRQQVQMIDSVKSFTTDSGAALRAWLDGTTTKIKDWLRSPWSVTRAGRTGGLLVAGAALLWTLGRALRQGWWRWRAWSRPNEFDPVRREAGRHLAWLREVQSSQFQPPTSKPEQAGVVFDLQRLRYGHKATWPEPRAVFKRARAARRTARV